MPARAVALHQRILDQPQARREAAEDDVLLQPADNFRLFLLARGGQEFGRDGLGFHGLWASGAMP